ncbi:MULTISPECIES: hypothetical protein [Bradyrhizobium]|uniref:hypothetical protein n=1 Tax=Bradyrhizobium TaxID=374 RepID=UPI0004B44A36|nr:MULTISPECIES: hypothetical protein [Bradyrhizobium]MBR0998766.1 hypothetical protein [Bradyrhizobium liaoningense]MBR1030047.1 hypothetical protein [Bradyrhizobium liaoningense]
MFNLLADFANGLGYLCADWADYQSAASKRWVRRGQYCRDVELWFRLRCSKPFAEIRAERSSRCQP